MADSMKKQLKHEINRLYEEFDGASAAYAPKVDTIEEMTDDFDNMVESGMTELEAYQALYKDVERMRIVLEKLPLTGREKAEEADRKARGKFNKWLKKLRGNMESIQWLLTTMLYFLISFRFGHWHMTWLLFVGGSMGSILLDMLMKYNHGVPLGKQKGSWSALLWLATVILYFLISFTFGHWHLTWMIFLVATILQILIGSDGNGNKNS